MIHARQDGSRQDGSRRPPVEPDPLGMALDELPEHERGRWVREQISPLLSYVGGFPRSERMGALHEESWRVANSKLAGVPEVTDDARAWAAFLRGIDLLRQYVASIPVESRDPKI